MIRQLRRSTRRGVRSNTRQALRDFPTTSPTTSHETEAPPFDKLRWSAVNWALDFDAINRTQAGFLPGPMDPAQQLPGYEPSRTLPRAQPAEGPAADRPGRREGPPVTVVSDNQDPTPRRWPTNRPAPTRWPEGQAEDIAARRTSRRRRRSLKAQPAGRTGPRTTHIPRTSSTYC